MANTIREENVLAIAPEVDAWGTAPNTNFNQFEVMPGEWMSETVEQWQDDMVRNKLAKNFNAVPTVTHAEGTMDTVFTSIMPGYLLFSVFGGETKANVTNATGAVDTGFDVHQFTVARDAIANNATFSILQKSGTTGVNEEELFLGMMVQTLTVRFSTGEGAVEMSADWVGKGKIFPATAPTIVENTMVAASSKPPAPFVGAQASVDINGNTQARVLDFEVVVSREISMGYGAANTRRPNILRPSTPEITFTATVEFQLESDLQKYSNDAGKAGSVASTLIFDETNASYWDSHFDTWFVRLATDPDVTTADAPIPTTAIGGGNLAIAGNGDVYTMMNAVSDSNTFMFDAYFDKVSYAEAPIVVDRSDTTATVQFSCRALYDFTDDRLGIFRLFNLKTTTYSAVDG